MEKGAIIDTTVGFMSTENVDNMGIPTYEELVSGSLGHIEVIQI